MDINSSGTGGAEDDNLKLRKEESEVGEDANHSGSRIDSRTGQSKSGIKIGVTSSGGVTSDNSAGLKNDGNDTAYGTPSKTETDKMSTGDKDSQVDSSGKRIRYDSYGNRITTTIGTFSVANRKNLIKNKKAAMSATSDTGGAETAL